MDLELQYDSKDVIPAGFDALYTERDGKFALTGIKGIKTQEDVGRLQMALNKERAEHKETKARLEGFSGHDPAKLADDLAELETLRVTGGKVDNAQLETLVEARLKAKLGPVERERDQLRKDLDARTLEHTDLQRQLRTRNIHDAVREAALGEKVIPEALEDILLHAERLFDVTEDGTIITRDNVGVTPGLDAKSWLKDMTKARPHWWPPSNGGGATGGKVGHAGDNPWSAGSWNLTKQGEYVRANGADKAAELARLAGSELGAIAPPRPAR